MTGMPPLQFHRLQRFSLSFLWVGNHATCGSVEHNVMVNAGMEQLSMATFCNRRSDLLLASMAELMSPEWLATAGLHRPSCHHSPPETGTTPALPPWGILEKGDRNDMWAPYVDGQT